MGRNDGVLDGVALDGVALDGDAMVYAEQELNSSYAIMSPCIVVEG
jgi:hypothetical protein